MFNILTMNTIASAGIDVLLKHGCQESASMDRPERLILRSADLHSGNALLVQSGAANHCVSPGHILSGIETHQLHCCPVIIVIRAERYESGVHKAVRSGSQRFPGTADVDRGRLSDDAGAEIRNLHTGACEDMIGRHGLPVLIGADKVALVLAPG